MLEMQDPTNILCIPIRGSPYYTGTYEGTESHFIDQGISVIYDPGIEESPNPINRNASNYGGFFEKIRGNVYIVSDTEAPESSYIGEGGIILPTFLNRLSEILRKEEKKRKIFCNSLREQVEAF